jgi:hypothetical protein
MRSWLRLNTSIAVRVAQRVYFTMPEQDRPELPCLVFYRVGGSPDSMLQEYPDFIIECWGANKHEASSLASTVAGEIELSNSRPPVIVDGVEVTAGTVNFGPIPSGGTDWAKRYRVDTSFHMRSA